MCGDVARGGIFSRNKGAPAFIFEDTDTLILSIGQFKLSQNCKV